MELDSRGLIIANPSDTQNCAGLNKLELFDPKRTSQDRQLANLSSLGMGTNSQPSVTLPMIEEHFPSQRPREEDLITDKDALAAYIQAHAISISDLLQKEIVNTDYLLVGEHHDDALAAMRAEVTALLSQLKEKGLTHIAFELNKLQGEGLDALDYSISDEELKSQMRPLIHEYNSWDSDGMLEMFIEAKRLGLEVLYVDKVVPAALRRNGDFENSRDLNMLSVINENVKEGEKVLVWIGASHVHESPTSRIVPSFEGFVTTSGYPEPGTEQRPINRLGTLLRMQHGDEKVVSISHLYQNEPLNAPLLKDQDIASLRDILPEKDNIAVPYARIGHPRTNDADYVIVSGVDKIADILRK